MVSNRDSTRIDTLELKGLIYQKIGRQRAEEYFEHLRRFLWSKLSKADFDKSCMRTLGRENIRLHNLLIRAIIQNSNVAKLPPQRSREVDVRAATAPQRSCVQSLQSNGLLKSPRKCRSPVNRERKLRDRPSPLGPLGKSPSLTYEETVSRLQEQSAAELHSISSKPPTGVAPVEEGEEVEQLAEIPCEWRSVTAPFGVSVTRSNTLHHQNLGETCQSSGELPDTAFLRSLLENKLASEGISVSLEGANAINRGLDAFLKRILEGCIPPFGRSHLRNHTHSLPTQQNGLALPPPQMQPQPSHLSLPSFRVVMETNPWILGEDWASQLEKISHHLSQ